MTPLWPGKRCRTGDWVVNFVRHDGPLAVVSLWTQIPQLFGAPYWKQVEFRVPRDTLR